MKWRERRKTGEKAQIRSSTKLREKLAGQLCIAYRWGSATKTRKTQLYTAAKGTENNILQSPGRRRRPFVSRARCHYTYTGPSICLIPFWAARVRRRHRETCVCVWGFHHYGNFSFSAHPLPRVPSAIYLPSAVIALAYRKACGAAHAPISMRTVTFSRALHGNRAFKRRSLRCYMHSFCSESVAKDVAVMLCSWHRAELLLKPCMKNASTNTDLFSLQLRGPLTTYRSHSPGFAVRRGYLNGKLG